MEEDGALAAALGSLASNHAAALAELRATYADDRLAAEWLASDVVIARYLVAHNGSFPAAARGLRATVAWRREHTPPALHCGPCTLDPGSHCFVPLGRDAAGRPLVYGCHARAGNQEASGMVQHVVHHVEHALRVSPAHQWRWVVDMHGFGLQHALQVRMAIQTLTSLTSHMPETLHQAVLLNAPIATAVFLRTIRGVLPARTAAKLVTVTAATAAEAEAALLGLGWSPEAAAWVGAASVMPPRPLHLPPLPAGARELLLPGLGPPAAGGWAADGDASASVTAATA